MSEFQRHFEVHLEFDAEVGFREEISQKLDELFGWLLDKGTPAENTFIAMSSRPQAPNG